MRQVISVGKRGLVSAHRRSMRHKRYRHYESLESRHLLAAELLISEFMASNSGTLVDGFSNSPDWIEIHNSGDTSVNLSGYRLTDDLDQLVRWPLPNVELKPDSFLVIFASGRNQSDPDDRLHTNFKLSADGEYLALVGPGDQPQILFSYGSASEDFPPQFTDISYGVSSDRSKGYLPTPTPGQANQADRVFVGITASPQVDKTRGFYDGPFEVTAISSDTAAELYYTTDGSDPSPDNTQALRWTDPIEIATTTNLRVAAFRDGYLPSSVETYSYVFLNDVIRQPILPDGVPATWNRYGIGPTGTDVPADYEMDPRIVDDPSYVDTIIDDLKSLPTMSLTMNGEDWFDVEQGIYVNPFRAGRDWEKEVSIEWLDPTGQRGFQLNAGIRVFGGWSRHFWATPKKSFTLRFRKTYGNDKLEFPIFGNSGTDEFNILVLRAVFSDAWPDAASPPQYLRDLFTRQTQLAMGQPASRGSWVHLYINGLYWGIYNPSERPDADYAAAYFGGDPGDYDAIKHGGLLGPGQVQSDIYEVIDGESVAWEEALSLVRDGLDNQANYQQFQQLVDVENLADYIILNAYLGNVDWPHKNWWANRQRGPEGRFRFYAWDSEYTLRDVNVNRLGVSNRNTPAELYWAARDNPHFVQMFADRVHKHLFNDGALQAQANIERYRSLASQIESAIVAESARWGDNGATRKGGTFFTRDDNWLPVLENLTDPERGFFGRRHDIVLDKFRRFGLYPEVVAPTLNQQGGPMPVGFKLDMSVSEGQIFYTVDSSDPRLPDGTLSASALEFQTAFEFDAGTIKARALVDGQWSALTNAQFTEGSDLPLQITELNFQPHEPVPGLPELDAPADSFEFIELANMGAANIDLAGVKLIQSESVASFQGVQFDFGAQILEPGQRVVVVRDRDAFVSRYGTDESIASGNHFDNGSPGEYLGELSEFGEVVTLVDATGKSIQQFNYGLDLPDRTLGLGSALDLIDGSASVAFGGTPGAASLGPDVQLVLNEVMTNGRGPEGDQIEFKNIGNEVVNINGWFLTDNREDYFKHQISGTSELAPSGYETINTQTVGFDFDGYRGGEIILIEADETGRPVRFVVQQTLTNVPDDVSVGRVPDGTGAFFPTAHQTFGDTNAGRRIPSVIINEIHYNPIDLDASLLMNAGHFEFIELFNHTDESVDISNWQITGRHTFEDSTVLGPLETILFVQFSPTDTPRLFTFQNLMGAENLRVVGRPTFRRLDDESVTVRLESPGSSPPGEPDFIPYYPQDVVTYVNTAPWPTEANGTGQSLNRISPERYGPDPTSWEAKLPSPGSLSGDINKDGRVNRADVEILFADWGPVPTLMPGHIPTGTVAATYNAATGEIIVSAFEVVSWIIESPLLRGLTGSKPTPLSEQGGLVTDNDLSIGDGAFKAFSYQDLSLGPVAAPRLTDLTLKYQASFFDPVVLGKVLSRIPADVNGDSVVDDTDVDSVLGRPNASRPIGDLDNDGLLTIDDVDIFFSGMRIGTRASVFDINSDEAVDSNDTATLITDILSTRQGDTNLDGVVDNSDFGQLATNFGQSAISWSDGDFDGDGDVDFRDFNTLAVNFGL